MARRRNGVGAFAFAWAPALLASAFLWSRTSATPSVAITYCASQNTGLTDTDVTYNYMSDGYCSTYCFTNNSYPLAVVQQKQCWCANLVPAEGDQVDTDNCDGSCPGYPSDWCATDGFYAYMTNGAVAASGTAGAASSTADSSSAKTTSASQTSSQTQTTPSQAAETSTSVIVETETVQTTDQSSVTSTSATVTSTKAGSTTATADSTNSDTTSTSSILIQTVTVGGQVTTVTSTPTAVSGSTGSDSAGQTNGTTKSTGLSGGQVAGVVVGIILGMAIICLIALFFWFRWRKQKQEANGDGPFDASSKRGSSAGMMGTPRTGDAIDRYANGANGRKMTENWESNPALSTLSASGRRRSGLLKVDPRLDYGKGMFTQGNISHESVNSLQDNEDYSRPVHEPARVLRATNPDPDA